MKNNFFIVTVITLLLASCTPGIPVQESTVTVPAPTEVTMTPELIVTDTPTATETLTQTPSETPPGCLTLLTPLDGAELPAMGRVTFSWNPMSEASFYILQIIQPSGTTVSFETEQTFRNQYMEAFSPGGSYQWKVAAIAQDRKRTEICSSELATFSKPASDQPQQTVDDGKKK